MNRRSFLRNLATIAAAVTASPLLANAAAKLPAPAPLVPAAKILLPCDQRFHTIWIEGDGAQKLFEEISEIRFKMNGKTVLRCTAEQLRNLDVIGKSGDRVTFSWTDYF